MFNDILIKFFNCCFAFINLIGLRNFFISIVAFFPPNFPTYTFRKQQTEKYDEKSVSNKQTPVKTLQNNENQDPLLTPKNSKLKRTDTSKDQGNQTSFIKQADDDSLRFYRISSFYVDQDSRPYLVTEKEQAEDISQSRVKSEVFKILFAKNKEPYKLMLITKAKLAVDIDIPEDLHVSGYYLTTRSGNTIATLLVQNTTVKSDYILLHSHQNSPDMGVLLDTYLDLAFNLSISVIGYDYSGFGQSSGQTNDRQCIEDIQTVYLFLINELGYQFQKIILYGQSIGSGPSIALASNPQYPVGGLIIHSGFTSGMRVYTNSLEETQLFDLFPNIELIGRINSLIYIIHGLEDNQVDSMQALQLAKNSRYLHKIWLVEQGGHNNIELAQKFRKDYFLGLRDFLKETMQRNSGFQYKNWTKLLAADSPVSPWNFLYGENLEKVLFNSN